MLCWLCFLLQSDFKRIFLNIKGILHYEKAALNSNIKNWGRQHLDASRYDRDREFSLSTGES